MLVYLGICAALAFLAGLVAAWLGVPPAPTFHLFFSAGAMPLIFGAVIHFVPVLTRTKSPGRLMRWLPAPVQLAGIATPLALAGGLPHWTLHATALVVSVAALVLVTWVMRRMRATLGHPHPGAHWYGAALLCLFLAVSLVTVWLVLPELRPALRLFHLHLNTLGFIGLAALGTLPVLLPTAVGRPDSAASGRLRQDLPFAVAGAIFIAAGAAFASNWLALPGSALLAWVIVRNLLAWRGAYGWRVIVGDGVTASLAAASVGLLCVLIWGIAHASGWLPARPTLAAFVAMFLLPLVTGALAQLLPVWRYPGVYSPARGAMRERLAHLGPWRALAFLAGGGLLALEISAGFLLVAVGLALFVFVLAQSLWLSVRLDRPQPSDDNPRPLR